MQRTIADLRLTYPTAAGEEIRQTQQVRLLIDAYGLEPERRQELPEAIYERMEWNVVFFEKLRRSGDSNLSEERIEAIIEGTRLEEVYVRENEVILFTFL